MENPTEWPLFSMEFKTLEEYLLLFWSGNLDDPRLLLNTKRPYGDLSPLQFHRYIIFKNIHYKQTLKLKLFWF